MIKVCNGTACHVRKSIPILERLYTELGLSKDKVTTDDMLFTLETVSCLGACGLGKSAALPVMSTLKLFRDEYIEHVIDKKCASHTCSALRRYVISPELCKGCSKCARNCPVGAISGKIKEPFTIDDSVCIKCGACESNCAFGAIHVEA